MYRLSPLSRGQRDAEGGHADCRPLDLGDDASSNQQDGRIRKVSVRDALVGLLSSTRPRDMSDASVLSHRGVEVSSLPSNVGEPFVGSQRENVDRSKCMARLVPRRVRVCPKKTDLDESRATPTDASLGRGGLFFKSLSKGTFDLIGCVLSYKRSERATRHLVGSTFWKVCQFHENGLSLLNPASFPKRRLFKRWWK